MRQMPMAANGWNLPIPPNTRLGKWTVPPGIGLLKLIGSESHYQDRDNSQEWQSQTSWLAMPHHNCDSRRDLLSRVGRLLCRASDGSDKHLQLFVDDVIGQAFLSTKVVGAIDLAQNLTYVILDLRCTQSMGSRYAVHKFIGS